MEETNISESNFWDMESSNQNSVKLDDMLSVKQVGNIRCNVCNRKQETLAKREEIAWERENVLRTREKELREWELMLGEKNQQLVEKERQLKYSKRPVLSIEAKYSSGENSRKTSISDIDLNVFSTVQHTDIDKKSNFILEKEKLLYEQRNVVLEKTGNIEKKEQSLLLKEQLLNYQKSIVDKEREMIVQKNVDVENREEVVKKIEDTLDAKLKDIGEKIKSLDYRSKLLAEKENALSMAKEVIQSREHILNEREQAVIEKEKNLIKQIGDFVSRSSVSYIELEYSSEGNQELLRKLVEIFEDKWKSVQQRENTVLHSELILQEKFKEFSVIKALFKSEEENLLAMKSTFEKEKAILREWEKLLQKQEDEVIDKSKLIERPNAKNDRKIISKDITESTSHLSQDPQFITENDRPHISCNEFKLLSDNECDLDCLTTNNIIQSQCKTPCSEDQEISGNELFQYYENQKMLLQMSLLKENPETCTEEQLHSNAEKNTGKENGLNEKILTFFKNVGVLKNSNETNNELVNCVFEISDKSDQSASSIPDVRNENEILLKNTQSNPIAAGLKNIVITPENTIATKSTATVSECGISLSKTDRINDKNGVISSSGTVEIIEKDKSNEQITTKIDVIANGKQTTNNISLLDVSETTVLPKHETGCKSLNSCGSFSGESEKSEKENDSCLKNGKNSIYTESSKVSCISPVSSASSTRSLTSPISGRCSPWTSKKQRKPTKDALLQAISQGNSLETVRLLDTNCMCLELRNVDGRSAILLAVEGGNIELVQRLIEKGADIRACDYKGYSALHIAVGANNSDMVLFLLRKGLNPQVTDINGNTVLQLASNLKLTSMIEIINNFDVKAK